MDCTDATIRQHCYWPNLRYDIRTHTKDLKNYQKNKKEGLKYGHLVTKEAETIPCYILLVDLIVQNQIRREGHYGPLILKSLTMMNRVTM